MKVSDRLREYAKSYREPPTGREVEGTVELLEEAAEHIDRLSDANGRDIVFKRCICEYGTQPQIDMCIELTKALLKYRRKFALTRGENVNPTNGDTDLFKARIDIIDELADVRIMCRQMELLFQAEDEVERRIDFKVDRQIMKYNAKARYSMQTLRGKTLLQWAVLWFKMSNDAFYELYGFNFNPHDYPMLYEIAREEVYGAGG